MTKGYSTSYIKGIHFKPRLYITRSIDKDEDKDEDKDKDKDKSQYHLAIFQGHLHFRLDVLALLVNRPVQLDVHL